MVYGVRKQPPFCRRVHMTPHPAHNPDNCTLASDTCAEVQTLINSITRFQALIEFTPDGDVITANPVFLNIVGYTLDEIQGKPHRMFCKPGFADSEDYQAFWQKLKQGETLWGEFERVDKSGHTVWLHGSYVPVLDADDRLVKVLKFTNDISEFHQARHEHEELVRALDRVQAVIEFDPAGHVLNANPNFLKALGYTLTAIVRIRPGERVPLDGVVTEGNSSINQAPVTGESLPVDKTVGDTVFAGTINGETLIEVEVTRRSTESTLARVIKMVSEAEVRKSPTQRFTDRFQRIFVPLVLLLVVHIAQV